MVLLLLVSNVCACVYLCAHVCIHVSATRPDVCVYI